MWYFHDQCQPDCSVHNVMLSRSTILVVFSNTAYITDIFARYFMKPVGAYTSSPMFVLTAHLYMIPDFIFNATIQQYQTELSGCEVL